MANVYAIKTGNWSDPTVWNTGALPTSADDVFSNNFTVTIDQNVTVLSIRNTAQSPAIAGGGYNLSGTFTVSATSGGFITGTTQLINYTGTDCVLNGSINGSATTAVNTVYHNSTGTLTINGIIINTANTAVTVVQTNSTGTLNINGNVTRTGRGDSVLVNSACIVNIVGDISSNTAFSGGAAIRLSGACTVNATGNVTNLSSANLSYTIVIGNIASTLNITGNVDYNAGSSGANDTIVFTAGGKIVVTGNVTRSATHNAAATISSGQASYISIIGSIFASTSTATATTFISTSASAINLLSGPFVCSPYGFMPFSCFRMHLIPSISTYFEFRDETTNGALPPGAIATPTRLISPASASDAPAQSDVRLGVVYANSSQIGTCAIPNTGSVAYGIPVDNTVGTAVINAEDIWKIPLSNISTSGSIGLRVKNVSTVQITGAQIAAYNG